MGAMPAWLPKLIKEMHFALIQIGRRGENRPFAGGIRPAHLNASVNREINHWHHPNLTCGTISETAHCFDERVVKLPKMDFPGI